MLEKYDIEVDMAESAEQAIEYLKSNRPDAIFMDHLMPGMDGPQLIAAVKALSPHIPAILISNKVRVYDHASQADVFLARGMYAPADLLERIRLLLVRKRGPKRTQPRSSPLPREIGVA